MACNITTMSCDEIKIGFASRMDEVCDLLGIPPKGKNRQTTLGKKFKVTQEAARKWLAGESIPQPTTCILIANEANVCYEWLMTGRGPKFFGDNLSDVKKTKDATKYLSLTPEKKYQVDALIDAMNSAPINDAENIADSSKRTITN